MFRFLSVLGVMAHAVVVGVCGQILMTGDAEFPGVYIAMMYLSAVSGLVNVYHLTVD